MGYISSYIRYYPFGLTMAGISSKSAGGLENKRKFNGATELNNDFDISLYETDFRSYDPQIGRFLQIDEYAEEFDDWSPFVFANDNPILLNDPTGLAGDTAWKKLLEVTVSGTKMKISQPLVYANQPGVGIVKNPNYNTFQNNGQAEYLKYRAWFPPDDKYHNRNAEMLDAAIEVATWVIPWGRVVKGGKWIYRAMKARQAVKAIKGVAYYLKLLKLEKEFDVAKVLYRGTTGSEAGASTLFLTDNAAVAATYAKNGGSLVSYEINQFALKSLQATGELSLKTGMHGMAGTVSTEYMFEGKNLVEALNSIAK